MHSIHSKIVRPDGGICGYSVIMPFVYFYFCQFSHSIGLRIIFNRGNSQTKVSEVIISALFLCIVNGDD